MTLADVYASDKRAAVVCSEMQWVGIGYDHERALQFSDYLRAQEFAAAEKADAVVNRRLKRTKSGGISTSDLMTAFFDDLGAPVFYIGELSGKPSLGANAMAAYAACHSEKLRDLAKAELERRRARKIRSTYIEAIKVGRDGRVHPSWLNYGTVSGRWACQGPNLANLPRAANDPTHVLGGIRSLYRASPGHVFVYYDKSQIEYRIAAYGSGDEAMIAVCEGGDVHSMNASILFKGAFDVAEYKALKRLGDARSEAQQRRFEQLDNLRTLAKTSVFAVCYLAEEETVYQRIVAAQVPVKRSQVGAMLGALRRECRAYYQFQDQRLLDCVREGYTSSPILGRQRWLGHEPPPTECANFLCQAGAADVMNEEIPRVLAAVKRESPTARLVAHVYDSVLIEVLERDATRVSQICVAESTRPVTIASSGRPLRAVLPLDISQSERWH